MRPGGMALLSTATCRPAEVSAGRAGPGLPGLVGPRITSRVLGRACRSGLAEYSLTCRPTGLDSSELRSLSTTRSRLTERFLVLLLARPDPADML